jgi:hypothetical protein
MPALTKSTVPQTELTHTWSLMNSLLTSLPRSGPWAARHW